MGYYINPRGMKKEEWLEENATRLEGTPEWPPPNGYYYVCLVENPTFTAAGVAYDERQFEAFCAPDMTAEDIAAAKARFEAIGVSFHSLNSGYSRPRTWYYAPISALLDVAHGLRERVS